MHQLLLVVVILVYSLTVVAAARMRTVWTVVSDLPQLFPSGL